MVWNNIFYNVNGCFVIWIYRVFIYEMEVFEYGDFRRDNVFGGYCYNCLSYGT